VIALRGILPRGGPTGRGPRADRRPGYPFIEAYPNLVDPQPGPGRTALEWDTGDGSDGMVKLVTDLDGRSIEVLVSLNGRGTISVDWIQPGYLYRFRLYGISNGERLLAETVVGMGGGWAGLPSKVAVRVTTSKVTLAAIAVLTRGIRFTVHLARAPGRRPR
jgi:hypothetical protein